MGGLIEFVSNTTLTSNVAGSLTATTIQIDGANTVVTVNSPTPIQIHGTILNYSASNGGDGAAGYGSFAGTGAPTSGPGTSSTDTSKTATVTATVSPAATPLAAKLGKGSVPRGNSGQIPFKVAGGQYVLTLDKPAQTAARTGQTPAASAKGGVPGPALAGGRNTRPVDKRHLADNNVGPKASSLPAQPRAVPALPR